jgi:hypothetical protein
MKTSLRRNRDMIDVLKKDYFSKADAFMLPLTGVQNIEPFEVNSYLFWRDNSIHDYKLTVMFSYTDKDQFVKYCQNYLFPLWDRKGYVMESYDFPDRTVFVLDMSEWANDIEQFLAGKYSKLTQKVKDIVYAYHNSSTLGIPIYIYAILYPKKKMQVLEGMNAIEYVSRYYDFDEEAIYKLGEIGGTYTEIEETLLTEIDSLCQNDSNVV